MASNCPRGNQNNRNGNGGGESNRASGGAAGTGSAWSAVGEYEDEPEVAFMMEEAAIVNGTEPKSTGWVLDSGATGHVCNSLSYMYDIEHLNTPIRLRVANGEVLSLHKVGKVRIIGSNGKHIVLKNVAYHPRIFTNLLSLHLITNAGYGISFDDRGAIIRSKATNKVTLILPKRGKLYVLDAPCMRDPPDSDSYYRQYGGKGHPLKPKYIHE